jgi:Flp pilus assembly pilin Flp
MTVWTHIKARLFKFVRRESGATAIEYALIAAAIFLGIAPIWSEIAPRMGTMYGALIDYFSAVGAI